MAQESNPKQLAHKTSQRLVVSPYVLEQAVG
jgi:hypothetical protein